MRELAGLIGDATRMVTLVHVSRECNDYTLVDHLAHAMLADLRRPDICLGVARQCETCPPYRFEWSRDHGAA